MVCLYNTGPPAMLFVDIILALFLIMTDYEYSCGAGRRAIDAIYTDVFVYDSETTK